MDNDARTEDNSSRRAAVQQSVASRPLPGPESRVVPQGARAAWAVGGVFIATALLTVVRLQVTGDALDRVWAEDGRIFLGDSVHHGFASLWYVYSGYLHTTPRLLAFIGKALPLHDYAAYTVVVSAVVTGLLASYVYVVARRIIGSEAWALLPALGMALTPGLRLESLGNMANLQWLLIFAAFWALLVPPTSSPRSRVAASAITGLAALTSPLTLLVLPAAALHGRRALRDWPVRTLLAGVAVQGLAHVLAPHSPGGVVRHPGFSGSQLKGVTEVLSSGQGRIGWTTVVGVVIGLTLALAWWSARSQRRLVSAAWGTGALVYVVTAVLQGFPAPRYEACAAMFVLAGIAMLGPRVDRRLIAVPLALLITVAVVRFPASAYRLSGPSWDSSVAAYRVQCQRHPASTIGIPLSPTGWGTVRLPCARYQ